MSGRKASCLLLVVHSAKLQGAQLAALGLAQSLADDYELVIAIGNGPLRDRFARLGSLVRQPTRAPIWGASRRRWAIDLGRAVPDAIRLACVARRRGAQAILANSTVLVAPVLAGRLARIPVLVCAHEAPTSSAARRLFRFHGALADTVIAISPWIAEEFASARARVVMRRVGIAVPPCHDRPPRPTDRPLRLLVVGTVDEHKRPDVAVAAVAELCGAGLDVELQIVGREADPAYAAGLHELVRSLGLGDRVRFVGEAVDVPERMRAADVLLVPAGEVTPLVLMEAMAIGTPVVAARMGSIPDVVVDGDSGLLVEPGGASSMATAIRRLADEPELAAQLARAARARVETLFDRAGFNQSLRDELKLLVR